MKRLPAAFSFFLLLSSACQPAEEKPISTEAPDQEHQTAPLEKASVQEIPPKERKLLFKVERVAGKKLELLIQNGQSGEFTYGRPFRIEKKVKDTWYVLPFEEGKNRFPSVDLLAAARKQTDETADLTRLKAPLSAGEHRIVKAFYVFSVNENGVGVESGKFELAAPFTVSH